MPIADWKKDLEKRAGRITDADFCFPSWIKDAIVIGQNSLGEAMAVGFLHYSGASESEGEAWLVARDRMTHAWRKLRPVDNVDIMRYDISLLANAKVDPDIEPAAERQITSGQQ